MATVISAERKKSTGSLPSIFFRILPPLLYSQIMRLGEKICVEEIRIRVGRRASVTSGEKNFVLDYVASTKEMESIFSLICDNSIYAHAETVNSGFVTISGGIRVGVVGRAAVEAGKVIGVYDISALCFRLPRLGIRVGTPVCRLIRELEGNGVLVYSPPGHGKTTLLRSVIRTLASGRFPMRVVVVDTREELAVESDGLCVDVLSGYPKALGIEIAARSMNAQLIVCDEIGGDDEVESIVSAQNCGVPLLATAHGGDICGLLRRTGIRKLHEACIFGAYVGIRRLDNRSDYEYMINTYGEANDYLQNSRSGLDSSLRRSGGICT